MVGGAEVEPEAGVGRGGGDETSDLRVSASVAEVFELMFMYGGHEDVLEVREVVVRVRQLKEVCSGGGQLEAKILGEGGVCFL